MYKLQFISFDDWRGEIVDFLLVSQLGGKFLKYLCTEDVYRVKLDLFQPNELANLRYLFRSTVALLLGTTMVDLHWITPLHAKIADSDDEAFLGTVDVETDRVLVTDHKTDKSKFIYLIEIN